MSDFEEIKKNFNIRQVIEQVTNSESKKVGEGTYDITPCPLCGHKGCFRIKEKEQFFNCFSCDKKGDIHNFIQSYCNLNPKEALHKLAEITGYSLTSSYQSQISEKKEIYVDAANYYHNNLLENKEYLNYQLEERGHQKSTLIENKVGLTDGKLHIYLTKKGYSPEEQLKSGLVKKGKGKIKDYFVANLFIYSHKTKYGDNYSHFTIKDRQNTFKYQFPNEYRNDDCLFYNMPALKSDTIILVEGENDVLSLMDAGCNEGIALCGYKEAQIEILKNWVNDNDRPKYIYLAFDNDDAGKKYTKKFINAFIELCLVDCLKSFLGQSKLSIKIIKFDSKYKDIDEYIVSESKGGIRKKEGLLKNLMKEAIGVTLDLKTQLTLYRKSVQASGGKIFNEILGKICAEFFNIKGKLLYSDSDGDCYLSYENKLYEISYNPHFNALMNKVAGLNASQRNFNVIRQEINDFAVNNGYQIENIAWTIGDIENSTTYFHLCNERNETMKISPGKVEICHNPNIKKMLLIKSPNMKEIDYIEDCSIDDSMGLLKELVYNNFACKDSYRAHLICRIISSFLLSFVRAKGIIKLSGSALSGKSTASDIYTTLLFGDYNTAVGSVASDYSEGAKSPLVCLDNLEDITPERREFLLVAATGTRRRKRNLNTQTDNTYEDVNTQLLWTAIEPPDTEELITRTIDILFHKKYKVRLFDLTELSQNILKHRNIILSGIFKLISKVLFNYKEKKKKALQWLEDEYGGHSKDRINELLSVLMLILQEVVKYINDTGLPPDKAHKYIMKEWIDDQNKISKETSIETNEIVKHLEDMVELYIHNGESFKKECPSIKTQDSLNDSKEFIEIEIEFIFKSKDLLNFIQKNSKHLGMRSQFKNARALGRRLKNSEGILKAVEWSIEIINNTGGSKTWKLTKLLEPPFKSKRR